MKRYFILLFLVLSTALCAQQRVLMFAGSTREGSVNKKLIAEAAEIAQKMDAKVVIVDLKYYPMPFYDAELEAKEGMPAMAREFRKLMVNSDAIFIASPEYNASVSAVLKNALDWASRGENAQYSPDAFKGKRFGIMSASPGPGGGARGLVHLRAILTALGGVVSPTEVSVPRAFDAFDAQGHLKDPQLKAELCRLVTETIQ